MELVRLVSHNSHKRLASCLQGQLGTDAEKRHVRERLSRELKNLHREDSNPGLSLKPGAGSPISRCQSPVA